MQTQNSQISNQNPSIQTMQSEIAEMCQKLKKAEKQYHAAKTQYQTKKGQYQEASKQVADYKRLHKDREIPCWNKVSDAKKRRYMMGAAYDSGRADEHTQQIG